MLQICFSPPTDKSDIHSLCPALGKRHALVVKGLCPSNLQNPLGKDINVSFCLHVPFAKPDPDGGSDFLSVKLLARKFRFNPRLIFERIVDSNSSDGLIHRVGLKL